MKDRLEMYMHLTMSTPLEKALETNINLPIDSDFVSKALSKSPWKIIDGVANCRDLGASIPAASIRSGYAFRSGTLEFITEQGKNDIVASGVKTIFDLRSEAEITANPDPVIEGVDVVAVALSATTTPVDAPKFSTVRTYLSLLEPVGLTSAQLPEMYVDMLTSHKASWKAILEYIRDHPDRPFLFHCTGETEPHRPMSGPELKTVHQAAKIARA